MGLAHVASHIRIIFRKREHLWKCGFNFTLNAVYGTDGLNKLEQTVVNADHSIGIAGAGFIRVCAH